MTINRILRQWLILQKANGETLVRYSDMEKVKNFAFKNYGIQHSVGTYEREFRRIKKKKEIGDGIHHFKDVSDKHSGREKVWKMIPETDLFE